MREVDMSYAYKLSNIKEWSLQTGSPVGDLTRLTKNVWYLSDSQKKEIDELYVNNSVESWFQDKTRRYLESKIEESKESEKRKKRERHSRYPLCDRGVSK